MTIARLDTLRSRLTAYLAAEASILKSQEYMIGNGGTARRNRCAELESVQAGIRECEAEIARLETITSRGRRVIRLRPL